MQCRRILYQRAIQLQPIANAYRPGKSSYPHFFSPQLLKLPTSLPTAGFGLFR
jgi:hypothetical protein